MSNNRVEESKMSGLAKSLTALEKFGKGRYNDQIAKLDEFAEKIHGFANKQNGGLGDYKKPFLSVANMPENQRNIEKPLAQLSDDLFKTKELFDSKPELFSKSEQAELKDTFRQIQIEGDRSVAAISHVEAFKGNIGTFLEKNTGFKSPEGKAYDVYNAANTFEDKLFKKDGELDFTKDNALADFKKEVSRLAGSKHTDIDFQAKKEGRIDDFKKSVKNYAQDFQKDLKTVEDKFKSGQLKLNPRESAKLEFMFDRLDFNKGNDKLVDRAFGKFSPNVAKPSNAKDVKPVIQGNLNKSISSPNLSKGLGGR